VKISLADPKNTLHIGNIPKSATEEQIKKHIIEVGKVTSFAPLFSQFFSPLLT
jgi:RNA recognition motif-containing protein